MSTARFSCRLGGGCLPRVVYTRREQNDWQTGVKTLPYPKLRLRAVTIFQFLHFPRFLTPVSELMDPRVDESKFVVVASLIYISCIVMLSEKLVVISCSAFYNMILVTRNYLKLVYIQER